MSTFLEDEENVGSVGSGDLVCRVGASSGNRQIAKTIRTGMAPGSVMRASVRFAGLGISARLLAFVDPLTGKAVVRMGMFDVSKDHRGHEVGPQVVWDSDEPIFDLKEKK